MGVNPQPGTNPQLDAAALMVLFERQRTGTHLSEVLRELARAAVTAGARAALLELSDASGPALMTAWPGAAVPELDDDPELPASDPLEVLPPGHRLLEGRGEFGVRAYFSQGGFTGTTVLTADLPAVSLEGLKALTTTVNQAFAALVNAWDGERRARDLAERHRLVSQATKHVIYDWDIATDTMTWNPRMAEVFGYATVSSDDIAWWRDRLHPDDTSRVWAALNRSMTERELYWTSEYRFQRFDGTWAWVFDRGTLVYDATQRPVRMLGVMEDISRDRELESRLTLASRLAAVGSLASGISHEINNPLAWVTSNLSFAQDELGRLARRFDASPELHDHQEHVEEVVEALDDAQTGATRIAQIVNDLRTFAHADNERLSPVAIKRVVEGALTMVNNELKHRARVVKRLDPAPMVLANEARLGQAVVNLLLNAAWSAGGAGQAPEVRIHTATGPDGGAVIEVVDNGPRLAPEVLPHLFDPFFNARPGGEGIGLGLAVTHSIVSGFGGHIDVDSGPSGTTFRVQLPMVPEDARHQQQAEVKPPPSPPVTQPTRRGVVFVIDDEPAILTAISRMLEGSHDVVGFTDPLVALAALAERAPDCILCDLMMPELSGVEVFRRIERDWPALRARVVTLTGGAFTAEAQAFVDAAPTKIIEKPFSPRRLRELVDRMVASVG